MGYAEQEDLDERWRRLASLAEASGPAIRPVAELQELAREAGLEVPRRRLSWRLTASEALFHTRLELNILSTLPNALMPSELSFERLQATWTPWQALW